jgi:hypothetical protein
MSDDSSAAWSCFRKKAYPDEKLARRVASQIRSAHGANVIAYGCPHCGRFHVGHAPRAQ